MTAPLLSPTKPGCPRRHPILQTDPCTPIRSPREVCTSILLLPHICRRGSLPPRDFAAGLLVPAALAQEGCRVEQCGSARRSVNDYSRLFTENKKAVIPVMLKPLPVFAEPTTYESLPVKIRAIKWDGTARHAGVILNWIHGANGRATYACGTDGMDGCSGADEDHRLSIHTLEGPMSAAAGSWIIQGTEGEFYPCKDSVFQRKYRALVKDHAPEINITAIPTPADVVQQITAQALRRNLGGLGRG